MSVPETEEDPEDCQVCQTPIPEGEVVKYGGERYHSHCVTAVSDTSLDKPLSPEQEAIQEDLEGRLQEDLPEDQALEEDQEGASHSQEDETS